MSEKRRTKVAFQGERAAYSEKAIQSYFTVETENLPCRSVYDVTEMVRKGEADLGVLPIENTIVGSITHTYDVLLESRLNIVGELIIPISHCLLGKSKMPLKSIRKIFSHPAALAQCEIFLRNLPDAEIIPTYDTAGSARMLNSSEASDMAAIAGREAADVYGLSIIKEGIEDYPSNQTRFVVISRDPVHTDDVANLASKTSVVFDTLDQPGMLYQCLGIFDQHKINLTSLESRPHKSEPWKYHFFVDMEGNYFDENIATALDEIKHKTGFVHVFGSYPRWRPEDVTVEPKPSRSGKKINPKAPLYSLDRNPDATVITVGDYKIGDGSFVIIAGPCSVEGRHQMLQTTKIVHEFGAHWLRGGAFKPRTNPYSFQGLGEEGLRLLAEAREQYNMPVVTEVLSVEDLDLVCQYADVLQVGARNMQNFVLLKEIAKKKKPVILKRGMMATVQELLNSAEYILAGGNNDVILCERGIRTFETATRNTLDLSAIPLLKSLTHLPVIADPSHGTGVRHLIEPMSKASVAVGADGLMVEVHFQPSTALSDGAQALDAEMFEHLMKSVKKLVDAR